jgi:hypothetical protein
MASDDSRFVRTAEIRAAVKGRESDILDALGIDWRHGRPHIVCPYPDHNDRSPSWRWDAKSGRAFCTCIEKTDNIFDVVIKVRRIDFPAAKLFVAETLHREDLIETKGSNSSRGQTTDAESLLNPPADNRDDTFPLRYLAGRCGITIDEVPVPSTKAIGIASLGFYDPPAKNSKNAKPKLVGHWPCAVFETIAADGRRHAHRIYLSLDGQTKAELGTTIDGKARDPKKSARRDPKVPSTAGLCAIWGNPDTEHVILAEGIENACAIAVSFREEITKGELAVLSAITAGGIEAFIPWPATRRITVAADRDEGKPGAGFKRGERAARNVALRLAGEAEGGEQVIWRNADNDLPVTPIGEPEPGPDGRLYQRIRESSTFVPVDELHTVGRQLEVLIALPGSPGTKYDFLDLFHDTDPDRVRSDIGAAPPFKPTAAEIEEFKNRGRRKSELDEFPFRLPPLIGLRIDWRHTETDEVWLYRFLGLRADKDTGEREEIWEAVSSPFGNFVLLLSTGEHLAHGLRVHVRTAAGTVDTVDFMRAELPKLGASGVRSAMMSAGVRVANDGEATIVEILKQIQPSEYIQTMTVFGRNRIGNECAFLTPGGKRAADYSSYLGSSVSSAKAGDR